LTNPGLSSFPLAAGAGRRLAVLLVRLVRLEERLPRWVVNSVSEDNDRAFIRGGPLRFRTDPVDRRRTRPGEKPRTVGARFDVVIGG